MKLIWQPSAEQLESRKNHVLVDRDLALDGKLRCFVALRSASRLRILSQRKCTLAADAGAQLTEIERQWLRLEMYGK
jgi:hypothetical protein